jgi:hypothetical protein
MHVFQRSFQLFYKKIMLLNTCDIYLIFNSIIMVHVIVILVALIYMLDLILVMAFVMVLKNQPI